jgi:hypothetical protein
MLVAAVCKSTNIANKFALHSVPFSLLAGTITDHWCILQMAEQAASKSAAELKATVARDQAELSRLQAEVSRLRNSVDAQVGVNKQLMARKEEVEWQLMSALAQASHNPIEMEVSFGCVVMLYYTWHLVSCEIDACLHHITAFRSSAMP